MIDVSDRWECSSSKCTKQVESASAAINVEELAEVGSGDEEPEQFCKCATSDLCNTTSCYNVAVSNVLVKS